MAPFENDLRLDVLHSLQQHETARVRKIAVDSTDFAAENAVNRNSKGRCFAVHRSAATDHEIGEPDQVETIDDLWWDDDFASFDPISPFAKQLGLLALIARKQDHTHERGLGEPIQNRLQKNLSIRVVIVRFGRWRPYGDHNFGFVYAEFRSNRRIRMKTRNVYVFL